MAQINRRRALIGLGTIVFGASGFVASGAVTVGSEGSLGDNWVQVEGTNQAIDLSPVQTDTGEQGSESGDADTDGPTGSDPGTQNSDDGTEGDGDDDGTEGDGDEETGGDGGGDDDSTNDGGSSTRVQVITNPDNPGNAVNAGGPVTWNGSVISDDAIAEGSDGFFQGIRDENLNKQATSVYGVLSDGFSGEPTTPAFIIANVGSADGGTPETPVSVSIALYNGDTEITTDQLRFPYRAVDASGATVASGSDLSNSAVTLSVGDVIEVAVVFDTKGGSEEMEDVDTIRFSATGEDN